VGETRKCAWCKKPIKYGERWTEYMGRVFHWSCFEKNRKEIEKKFKTKPKPKKGEVIGKCAWCGKEIYRGEKYTTYRGRMYHVECFEKHRYEIEVKGRVAGKPGRPPPARRYMYKGIEAETFQLYLLTRELERKMAEEPELILDVLPEIHPMGTSGKYHGVRVKTRYGHVVALPFEYALKFILNREGKGWWLDMLPSFSAWIIGTPPMTLAPLTDKQWEDMQRICYNKRMVAAGKPTAWWVAKFVYTPSAKVVNDVIECLKELHKVGITFKIP